MSSSRSPGSAMGRRRSKSAKTSIPSGDPKRPWLRVVTRRREDGIAQQESKLILAILDLVEISLVDLPGSLPRIELVHCSPHGVVENRGRCCELSWFVAAERIRGKEIAGGRIGACARATADPPELTLSAFPFQTAVITQLEEHVARSIDRRERLVADISGRER